MPINVTGTNSGKIDITTGVDYKNISIYITSFKIKIP